MSSVTLAESAKLAQNELVAGVIKTVYETDLFFDLLPFQNVSGKALQYTRENVPGTADYATVGTDLTAASYSDPATFTEVTVGLKRLAARAEVDNFIQAQHSAINDQTAIQIASKAKTLGQKFQADLINGDGTGNSFAGLLNLCAPSQKIATAANGEALSLERLDELSDMVDDKAKPDWFTMSKRTRRSYTALLRQAGGASITESVTLPSGEDVPAYNGVPIFVNDYVPVDLTQGSATTCTTILAGTFDDGAQNTGVAGLTSDEQAGMTLTPLGELEDKDAKGYRMTWYCGLALFNERGLAALPGITN